MTFGEKVNAFITMLSVIAAAIAAYFAYSAQQHATALQRPHLRVDLALFESRSDNGIKLHNAGMTPARIFSYELVDNPNDPEVMQADLDLESVGWRTGQLVHHPINGRLAIAAGQSRPLISVDRKIGETDIAILGRKFSKTSLLFCYCDMGEEDCWKYKWSYISRGVIDRDEVQVENCQ